MGLEQCTLILRTVSIFCRAIDVKLTMDYTFELLQQLIRQLLLTAYIDMRSASHRSRSTIKQNTGDSAYCCILDLDLLTALTCHFSLQTPRINPPRLHGCMVAIRVRPTRKALKQSPLRNHRSRVCSYHRGSDSIIIRSSNCST